jgi:pimeloyl-ACP methyl ester carboxylesterase
MRFAADTGVANIQSWRVFNRPVNGVSLTASNVHFEFSSTTGIPFIADGELKGNVIEGTMRRGPQEGKFHLIRLARVDRAKYDKYVGAYSFPDPKQPGKFQLGLITYGALGHLRYVNLQTGDTTALFPISENIFFFAGSVAASPAPDAATWSFETNKRGDVSTSVVRIKGQPDRRGTRSDSYRQEEVTIRSLGATIAGTLVLPISKGKHPAVVFVPGSNALSRDESSPFREFDALIKKGIAILVYDKRGVGQSTGRWEDESFQDLADDVLAMVRFLKGHREIDHKKIGLWGFSQGGWIAPLAASRSKDIAFVVMTSGGGVTNEEAETNDQVARMRRQKLTEDEIKDAIAFMRLQFQAAYSVEGWQQFQSAIPAAKDKRWFPRTWGRIPETDWWWKWWALNGHYNPAPVLAMVKVPVLAIFGADDELTLPEVVPQLTARIESALKNAGNKDVTTRIFPAANHDMSIKLDTGQWTAPAGYADLLTTWISDRVNKK